MKYALLALLLVAFNASATNPPNDCGNRGNNCNPNGDNNNGGSGTGYGGDASAAGVGIAVSSSVASGGQGGDGGQGGSGIGFGGDGGSGGSVVGSGNSSNLNANTAKGGSAHQSQGQSLNSANLLRMTSENTNRINASSANDNRSSASGNTTVTNVGGDSTLVERNAPPVFLGNLSATMSCSGGFNAGASDRNGSGAFGFTWISSDCRSVVIGKEFLSIGMPDVSCRIWKTTKGYKRAVKADPSLADVDCTAKPAPVPVPVLVAPELAPRIPRG